MLCSCTYTQYKPDERTPLGIKIISNGVQVDHALIDAKYMSVMMCYGITDMQKHIKHFYVYIIKNYKTLPSGIKYWHCLDTNFKCTGRYDCYKNPPLIKVLPDLLALGHELGHMLANFEFDGMHSVVEGGCTISHLCGDKIDSYFNKGILEQNWNPRPDPSKLPCPPFFP